MSDVEVNSFLSTHTHGIRRVRKKWILAGQPLVSQQGRHGNRSSTTTGRAIIPPGILGKHLCQSCQSRAFWIFKNGASISIFKQTSEWICVLPDPEMRDIIAIGMAANWLAAMQMNKSSGQIHWQGTMAIGDMRSHSHSAFSIDR